MTATQTPPVAQDPFRGSAADDWASLMEPSERGFFAAVLASGLFTPGTRVLDAGSGGLLAERIAARGCEVVGLDSVPLPDEYVGIVIGINTFQYAASPRRALAEARRVTRRGGHVILGTWGPSYACEAATSLFALKPLLPSLAPHPSDPFALSEEAVLKNLVASADLTWLSMTDVDVTWQFDDTASALTAMLSAGPSILAIQASGRDPVAAALERAISPYRLANGGYRLENRFRFVIATRD